MAVPKKTLVIEPRTKPRYTLKELLGKSRRKALKPSRKDGEWLSGGPVGKKQSETGHFRTGITVLAMTVC